MTTDILAFTCPVLAPQVRVIKDSGEPRFIAADLCGILGISNVSSACEKLPAEDRGITLVDTPNGPQRMITITEAGMYWLIIRSDKPAARPLIMWVTHDVLPALRREGKYVMPDQRQQKATRWGWQPIRKVVSTAGYSARDFVQSANALYLPDVATFTESNYAAWSYGGCLPADSLIIRAEKLLNVPRSELFTEDVLANYKNRGVGRRHGLNSRSLNLPRYPGITSE